VGPLQSVRTFFIKMNAMKKSLNSAPVHLPGPVQPQLDNVLAVMDVTLIAGIATAILVNVCDSVAMTMI